MSRIIAPSKEPEVKARKPKTGMGKAYTKYSSREVEGGIDFEINEFVLFDLLLKPFFNFIEGNFVDGDVFALVAAAVGDFLELLGPEQGDDFIAQAGAGGAGGDLNHARGAV